MQRQTNPQIKLSNVDIIDKEWSVTLEHYRELLTHSPGLRRIWLHTIFIEIATVLRILTLFR